jgi:hypothetical protein
MFCYRQNGFAASRTASSRETPMSRSRWSSSSARARRWRLRENHSRIVSSQGIAEVDALRILDCVAQALIAPAEQIDVSIPGSAMTWLLEKEISHAAGRVNKTHAAA